jgi:hypothetical protein
VSTPAPAVTWVTPDQVAAYLGVTPVDPGDVTHLTQVTAAANQIAYDTRVTAGYIDDPATVPNPAVELGTIMYAAARYRERSTASGYPAFDDLGGGFIPPGSQWRTILRHWGCFAPQVDAATTPAAPGAWWTGITVPRT